MTKTSGRSGPRVARTEAVRPAVAACAAASSTACVTKPWRFDSSVKGANAEPGSDLGRNRFPRATEAIMSRIVYLIHLDRPLAHARHYLGSTDDLERRLHEQGNGSKMPPAPAPSRRRGAGVAAVARAGISWRLARTKSWPQLLPGDRTWERRLKRYWEPSRRDKKSRRLCPLCSAGAHGRMQKP
jgi:hypothetical protein